MGGLVLLDAGILVWLPASGCVLVTGGVVMCRCWKVPILVVDEMSLKTRLARQVQARLTALHQPTKNVVEKAATEKFCHSKFFALIGALLGWRATLAPPSRAELLLFPLS